MCLIVWGGGETRCFVWDEMHPGVFAKVGGHGRDRDSAFGFFFVVGWRRRRAGFVVNRPLVDTTLDAWPGKEKRTAVQRGVHKGGSRAPRIPCSVHDCKDSAPSPPFMDEDRRTIGRKMLLSPVVDFRPLSGAPAAIPFLAPQ